MLKNRKTLTWVVKNLNLELYFAFGETTILAFCSKFRNFSLKNHFEINLTKKSVPTYFPFKILTSKFLQKISKKSSSPRLTTLIFIYNAF
jgi:hypothetical protein